MATDGSGVQGDDGDASGMHPTARAAGRAPSVATMGAARCNRCWPVLHRRDVEAATRHDEELQRTRRTAMRDANDGDEVASAAREG